MSDSGKSGLKSSNKKQIFSWALYDFGNSAFATTVMAAFFPVFFKKYWSHGVDIAESTYNLGVANSLGSLCLAISAPILGAIADCGSTRKKFLFGFTLLGVVMTGGLYFVEQGQWPIAVFMYVFASFGFFGANIFYDSLLVIVAKGERLDYVSSLGYSLGYLGGSLLLTVNVAMTMKPEWFGLANSSEAVRYSFLTVAAWWLVFALPLMFNVKETGEGSGVKMRDAIKNGLKQLNETFHKIKTIKPLLTFLLAYIFYIDGVNTMVKMAVDYGMSLGFDSNNLIAALLITNFVAFPAAIGFGYLGEKWGAKTGIYIALLLYIVFTYFGYLMTTVNHFYILAGAIGLIQGGIQALSRSYYATMIPAEHTAEFFGFFNMVGKFSAIMGPFLVGYVSVTTGSPRLSILVILVFFILGAGLLRYHTHVKRRYSSP